MKDGEFKKSTVIILAARAANMCSNPECVALTSGPSSADDRAVNVGEAAHIYGGKPGAARYDEAMTEEERSDPTNGIWLCRICHKKIDADVAAYPPGLLFEWKRAHDAQILSHLGKSSDLRVKVQERILAAFPSAGYFAEQTILDKPDHWEYKLTAQLLRQFLDPLQSRFRQLNDGYYAMPIHRVKGRECIEWVQSVTSELGNQVGVLSKLVNDGFKRAWGPDGMPGSEHEIYAVCKFLRDACAQCIAIEEVLRFTQVDEEFSDVLVAMNGIIEPVIEKIFSITPWLAEIFDEEKPVGRHALKLVFTLPDGWPEQLATAIQKGIRLSR